MSKDISKIMVKIEDEAGWTSVVESSETRLVIIDVHQDWCGKCDFDDFYVSFEVSLVRCNSWA
jgi:hypothetical protein